MEGIDIAWVEEADAVSQRSITLLTPTLRTPNSEIWFSWNRRNVKDPVDNMFMGGKPPPNSIIKQVNWRDNPWFPIELRDELEWDKDRDYDKYLHVWEGHPISRSETKVFTNWKVEDIDREVPHDCVPRFGADWGFSVDPTVLVKAYIWGRTIYFREEAYKVKCEIDETPSLFAGACPTQYPRERQWKNRNNHEGIEGALKYPIVADSSRPDTISYMKRRGFKIRGAKKGAGSIEDGVEFLKSFDIVVHPDCVHIADELRLYSYKTDPLTDEVLPELEDKNNHTIDAARYALESIRRRGLIAPYRGYAGSEALSTEGSDDEYAIAQMQMEQEYEEGLMAALQDEDGAREAVRAQQEAELDRLLGFG